MGSSSRTIHLRSVEEARALFGEADHRLRQLEERYPIKVVARGLGLTLKGRKKDVEAAERQVTRWRELIETGGNGESAVRPAQGERKNGLPSEGVPVPSKRRLVQPRNESQRKYLEAIHAHDITFAVGPAGTGKTYLAVAMAVMALRAGEVSRIVLVRPAVEAGEKLGYLPGTFQEKIDPYLRPLYDALYDTLEPDTFRDLLERGVIEIAPLAFMRGRTLNDAFIILDEAQNTTVEQMKMFLTRMGFDSKAVITGDVTQTDLPAGKPSGLLHVLQILKGIPGLAFVTFDERDVVRHELVQRIIRAYAQNEQERTT